MLRAALLITILFLSCYMVSAQQKTVKKNTLTSIADTFPVPAGNKHMLFYMQRTTNINTIVYELNVLKDGSIDPKTPVHPYWIRYTEKNTTKELDFIQQHFAFGVKMITADKKGNFALNFVSYDKRSIYLTRSDKDKQYHAYMNINGKLSEITRIFVHIEGGTFWVPNIVYVELTGKDAAGNIISERFKP